MRLIDADALNEVMYHEAFETDSDMQKWDSGCWIRYKMFEKAIRNAPTIEAEPIVRCGECKHRAVEQGGIVIPPDGEDGWTDYTCPFVCDDWYYNRIPSDEWFCYRGERREDATD